VLNGYVTNPNPTPTLTPNPNLNPNPNPNRINKKSKKKRLYKIDRAVCWMEKSANPFIPVNLQFLFVTEFHSISHLCGSDSGTKGVITIINTRNLTVFPVTKIFH
jgi:hypothetical protein